MVTMTLPTVAGADRPKRPNEGFPILPSKERLQELAKTRFPSGHRFPGGTRVCDRFLATLAPLPRYSPPVGQPAGGDDIEADQCRS